MKHLLPALLALALAVTPSMAQTPECTPAPSGLAAWWTFDETAGNSAADLLRGPAGQYGKTPSPVDGYVSGALLLRGQGDYVDVPGDRLNAGRGDFSLALWIRTDVIQSGVTTIIDKRVREGGVTRGYSLWLYNGKPGFQLADNSGPDGSCSNHPGSACTNYGFPSFIADGKWHLLVVSVNRGAKDGGAFYLDGALAATFDPTLRRGSLDNDAPFRIGAHTGVPHGFVNACLDEVQFYRRALGADEVEGIYAAAEAGLCKNVPPTRVVSSGQRRRLFVPGIVIIKLTAGDAAALRDGLARGIPFASLPFPAEVRTLNQQFGAVKVELLFPTLPVGVEGGLDRIFTITIDKTRDAGGAALTYARAKGVEYAQPDSIGRIQQAGGGSTQPQWNLKKINMPASGATGKGIIVAVLDTGIDRNHPDLQANMAQDGWDFADNDSDPTDVDGHGTQVAGVIAAAADGKGITGVAPGATLMAVRCGKGNAGTATAYAKGVVYAADHKARVLNISWVVPDRQPLLENVIRYARSKGAVVVSAAGNFGESITGYAPANVESGITVSATNANDVTSGYNFGSKLDVSAPGEGFLSTTPGTGYTGVRGTSFSAPHVAGLVALLMEKNPTWTPEQIRQAIRLSAFDIAPNGFDEQTGFGRIDVTKALNAPAPAVATLEVPRNGETVSGVVQVIGAAGADWSLTITTAESRTTTALASGKTAVSERVLATLDTRKYPDGLHTLYLTTKSVSTRGDRNVILIDNSQKEGWPAAVEDGYSKSPMVADLDGDGQKEVILGTAVFDAKGKPRPNWEAAAGSGRSNPAIADIDGDGDLELVAAVLDDSGGHSIYAYDAGKKQLWTRPVLNPKTQDDDHAGIPSTISIADIDGNGKLEVVFTVYFSAENSAQQTHVFILDARTGVIRKRFTVSGRSVSSVALVPSGNERLLVIASESRIHVVKPDGTPFKSWAQKTSGEIDPVVADFDLDGKPDILVGANLWSLDGQPKMKFTGVAAPLSTGAAGQLSTGDCELEAVLGGSQNVVYWAAEHDAKTKVSIPMRGESEAVPFDDDNGSAGAPIVADLDGDGDAEIIRPADLAYADGRPAKLYATDGMKASSVPGFPRSLATDGDIIRSSAAVDDIDGDGLTDVLIAAGGELHAWNLRTPFEAANNPWPMFQHDLAHTGYLPPGPTGSDLWIEDTPVTSNKARDDGSEPPAGMTAFPAASSRAIRVRNAPNSSGPHQNPIAGKTNEVLVTVRNRGCKPSQTATLELWSATAGQTTSWRKDWTQIGTTTIPPIAPGTSKEVAVQWTPPQAGELSLVARIATEPMTHAETANVEANVRKNNNLAWRTVTATGAAAVADTGKAGSCKRSTLVTLPFPKILGCGGATAVAQTMAATATQFRASCKALNVSATPATVSSARVQSCQSFPGSVTVIVEVCCD